MEACTPQKRPWAGPAAGPRRGAEHREASASTIGAGFSPVQAQDGRTAPDTSGRGGARASQPGSVGMKNPADGRMGPAGARSRPSPDRRVRAHGYRCSERGRADNQRDGREAGSSARQHPRVGTPAASSGRRSHSRASRLGARRAVQPCMTGCGTVSSAGRTAITGFVMGRPMLEGLASGSQAPVDRSLPAWPRPPLPDAPSRSPAGQGPS